MEAKTQPSQTASKYALSEQQPHNKLGLMKPEAYVSWLHCVAALICSGQYPEAKQVYRNYSLLNGLWEELDRAILICDIEVRLPFRALQ